ncbi:hypothetical protein V1517DRAFT_346440 [Lipomyces orientalis]|uniref:Uncharacterized protein n=1 Tax=Lipomyces orientalis TaxID=1233043 RepID=A0ACC3TNK3_9ASCO
MNSSAAPAARARRAGYDHVTTALEPYGIILQAEFPRIGDSPIHEDALELTLAMNEKRTLPPRSLPLPDTAHQADPPSEVSVITRRTPLEPLSAADLEDAVRRLPSIHAPPTMDIDIASPPTSPTQEDSNVLHSATPSLASAGVSDASLTYQPLLPCPPVESHHQVTYTVISFVLAPAAGYMISSFWNSGLHIRLSMGYYSGGTPGEIMGLMQGMYGVGPTISPLISSAMATSRLLWSHYYFILLGLGICITCLNAYAFWGETAAKYLKDHEDGEAQGRLSEALKKRYSILLAFVIFLSHSARNTLRWKMGSCGWLRNPSNDPYNQASYHALSIPLMDLISECIVSGGNFS